jgi:flagellar biosynthesis protein FlhG
MVPDQADELRQLVRQHALAEHRARGASPLVVVSGGKQGVGTTTIAVNLAIALARRGNRALLVDADLDHGQALELPRSADRGSLVDVLAGLRTVHEVLERGPAGIQVLPGAPDRGVQVEYPAASQGRLLADLAHLGPHVEVVIIDAGSSRGSLAHRLWSAADAVVTVTTADSLSVTRTYAMIKMLAAGAAPSLQMIVNLTADALVASDVHARVEQACRRFLGFTVTMSGHVAACERSDASGSWLVFPPRAAAARALDTVAEQLWMDVSRQTERSSRAA